MFSLSGKDCGGMALFFGLLPGFPVLPLFLPAPPPGLGCNIRQNIKQEERNIGIVIPIIFTMFTYKF